MLYYLFQYLEKFDFPGAGMFGYVSFRSLMAIILSLLIQLSSVNISSTCSNVNK